ncbi:MAG: hypothetical protein QOC76_5957, partial [Mycobacterium sp.]|nr:hypothetical protein [Mycobacterium sp.]
MATVHSASESHQLISAPSTLVGA